MAETKLESLSEIFNQKLFRIPDYQRGYAWKDEHLEDFWEDIQNIKESRYHYTGLLTVEKIKLEDIKGQDIWKDDLWMIEKGYNAYYVIDGQQRLTTIIILIKTILDKFQDSESINFTPKADLVKKYLFQEYSRYKSFLFGYEKDNPSDEYFKTKILDQVSLSSDRVPIHTLYTWNLNEAKEFFKRKLDPMSKEDAEKVFKKVVNSLRFNFYEIDNELDVFITFEVMNNRGKELSKLELLKNRLIYLSTLLDDEIADSDKIRLRKDINEAWKTIYEFLGKNKDTPIDDDDFLRNHWIMFFEYSRSESQIYAKYLLNKYFTAKNVLGENPELEIGFDEIKTYVESISESVKKWFYIFNPSFPDSDYNEEIKEQLEKLNRLGFGAFSPLIMAAMIRRVDNDKLLKLLKAAERFIFLAFNLSRRPSNTRDSHFYRKANEFFSNSHMDLNEIISDIEEETVGSSVEEGWFDIKRYFDYIDEMFKKEEGYYSWNGLRYFLYEYELYLKNKASGSLKVDWDDIKKRKREDTIEHIYPRDASKECWKKIFNEYESNNGFLLHSLGNLLLLSRSKNSQLQNECFDFKKKHIDSGDHEIGYYNGSYNEIEVAQFEKWSPEEILIRGINMLKFMEKRWGIEIGDDLKKAELLKLDFLVKKEITS
ncbi:MAG: DUF262 domain-containing protein [Candidatus Thermoplasmatota archaeon]|nr:DUF262 domain-containing protein [Candidatus Thermoplasmatota archaeon]